MRIVDHVCTYFILDLRWLQNRAESLVSEMTGDIKHHSLSICR